MELHRADKHVQLVAINMVIYNERRKSIFLLVLLMFHPLDFTWQSWIHTQSVFCSFVFQILQGRVYLFLKLPLSDWIK